LTICAAFRLVARSPKKQFGQVSEMIARSTLALSIAAMRRS
jgi:hypothetical protein